MTDVTAPGASRRARGLWIAQGAALLLLAILAGVIVGETPLPLSTVAASFANHLWNAGLAVDPIDAGIIWSYRLPRTLVAAACGAGLALSGVVLQALVRNALADPYLLGVSAGAARVRLPSPFWVSGVACWVSRAEPLSGRRWPLPWSQCWRVRRVAARRSWCLLALPDRNCSTR